MPTSMSRTRGRAMKKLGLIGGMGPESTIPYYHDIVHGVHALSLIHI